MLDFHRIRGHDTMVFWRFSLKKFSRFNPGDLVFFIDGSYRHPKTNEKGIIGYGQCTEIRNKSPKKTWDHHHEATGYASYEDFTEAIKHYRKNDHRLPHTLQVIKMDTIYLFQSPIYLSEVGIELNPRLESFTYIEQEGVDKTIDLLKIGKKVGIDQWLLSQNVDFDEDIIDKSIYEQEIRRELNDIQIKYDETQIRLIKNHTDCVAYKDIYYKMDKFNLNICYPLTHLRQFNEMVGLKYIIVYSQVELSQYHLDLLNQMSLKLEYI